MHPFHNLIRIIDTAKSFVSRAKKFMPKLISESLKLNHSPSEEKGFKGKLYHGSASPSYTTRKRAKILKAFAKDLK